VADARSASFPRGVVDDEGIVFLEALDECPAMAAGKDLL
jgi:hypothetical protein